MGWFRAIFKSDDDGDRTITLDVLTDGQDIVDPVIRFFGLYEIHGKGGELWPFVFTYDGLDYGNGDIADFPIRGKRLVKGSIVRYVEYEGEAKREKNTALAAFDFFLHDILDLSRPDDRKLASLERSEDRIIDALG